jgi:rod shape-determining protein MreD
MQGSDAMNFAPQRSMGRWRKMGRRSALSSSLSAGPTGSAWRVAGAVLVFTLLQSVLTRLPVRFGAVFNYVDFALILTVFVGVQPNALRALAVGGASGLAQDVAVGSLLGASGFVKTALGYTLSAMSVRFSLDAAPVRLLVLPLASAFNTALYVFFHYFFSMLSPSLTLRDVVKTGMWQMLGNVILGILLFPILDRTLGRVVAVRGSGQTIDPRLF